MALMAICPSSYKYWQAEGEGSRSRIQIEMYALINIWIHIDCKSLFSLENMEEIFCLVPIEFRLDWSKKKN